MRFIRAYWGNLNEYDGKHIQEIKSIASTTRLNDYIYVWGVDNYEFIKSLGFEAELVDENPTQYGTDFLNDSNVFMFHKLDAVKRGCMEFGSVIFLDWDTVQLKEIDDEFYKLLKHQNSKIQMPLYIYPPNYVESVLASWKDIPEKVKKYINKQFDSLKKHHYEWNGNFVTPNAGFIYCTDSNVIDELFEICKRCHIEIASEEMAMVEYSKEICDDIVDYVKVYEPIVCDGKDVYHFNQSKLNRLIKSNLEKNLYFLHR